MIQSLFEEPLIKTAEFSPDRIYRYKLTRRWDSTLPYLGVIGLNPSTADETHDDPTIRRCINYAKAWGCGGLLMGNLFAFRSTDPKGLLTIEDPTGPLNDDALRSIHAESKITLAAWGIHGKLNSRGEQVIQMLTGLFALGVTQEGFPKHPLYLKKDLQPVLFSELIGRLSSDRI